MAPTPSGCVVSVKAQPGKAACDPYGIVAFVHSLPTSCNVRLNYVHSLPQGADAAAVDIDGTTTLGQINAIQAIANAFAGQVGSYGATANDSAQITALLLSVPPHPPAFQTAIAFLQQLSQRLTLRSYLVGHAPSAADWAAWGSLKTNPVAQGVIQGGQVPHVKRWYAHLSALEAAVKADEEIKTQAKVKPASAPAAGGKAKDKEPEANATFELGLPNAVKGHVVTRLPPEPSGYLHIGHAKAAVLNQYFARMYEGKFLIRFDDTNPSKEKAEFEESIIEDLALLGIKADATSYTSDFFDQLHIYCVQMIKSGHAYADDTEQEKMRDERMHGIPSERRESTPEESLARFAEMATGSEEGRRWCIRAKISPDDPNKALRDPVIFRCNLLPHHRTGTRYKMYPTYDFACPVVDSLEGVTHALRTNEYRDRNPQYQWMLTSLGLRKVDVWDFGRLGFVYTLLSKRKLKWFVEEGYVRGWDDPRFATVRGIRRRGMTIEAITQFMLLQGPSQAYTNLEWDIIWTINKKVIDPIAPRHVALAKEGLVKVIVRGEGTPASPEQREMPKHKKNPDVGTKLTAYADTIFVEQEDAASFAVDEEVTFMDWGNAFVRKINRDGASSPITTIELELNLTGDFKKTKKKITWLAEVPAAQATLVPVTLLDYDYLITKKKLEEDDDVKDCLTPQTEFRQAAVADANVRQLKQGDIIQFERKGYYIVDRAFDASQPEQEVELILIPDGRAASIASKHAPPETVADKKAAAAADKSKNKDKAPKGKKAASAPPAGARAAAARGFPETAPTEAQNTTLLSDGATGFEIPYTTKMYRVENLNGEEGVQAPAKTDMYKVQPVHAGQQ